MNESLECPGMQFPTPLGTWLRHISEVSGGADTADPRKKFVINGGLSLGAEL